MRKAGASCSRFLVLPRLRKSRYNTKYTFQPGRCIIWVQLLTRMYIDGADGRQHPYQPGDFVDIGKQTARQWIAQGKARVLDYKKAGLLPAGAGVMPYGVAWDYPIDHVYEELEYAPAALTPSLPFYRTLLWQPGAPLRRDMLATGFALLDTWQLAVPLVDYTQLANSIGDEQDRQNAEAILHDLRIPIYDIRLIFVRRCAETEALLANWEEMRLTVHDLTLSFMCALYVIKPLILPLPMTWGTADGKDGYP